MRFIYQSYSEKSGKGYTPCQFALGQVYQELGALYDKNNQSREKLTYHGLDQEKTSDETYLKEVLEKTEEKARGKFHQHQLSYFTTCFAAICMHIAQMAHLSVKHEEPCKALNIENFCRYDSKDKSMCADFVYLGVHFSCNDCGLSQAMRWQWEGLHPMPLCVGPSVLRA